MKDIVTFCNGKLDFMKKIRPVTSKEHCKFVASEPAAVLGSKGSALYWAPAESWSLHCTDTPNSWSKIRLP